MLQRRVDMRRESVLWLWKLKEFGASLQVDPLPVGQLVELEWGHLEESLELLLGQVSLQVQLNVSDPSSDSTLMTLSTSRWQRSTSSGSFLFFVLNWSNG